MIYREPNTEPSPMTSPKALGLLIGALLVWELAAIAAALTLLSYL